MKKSLEDRIIDEFGEDDMRDRIAEQMAGIMFLLGAGVYVLLVAFAALALFVVIASAIAGR